MINMQALLEKTSRTFAVTIPLLPEITRNPPETAAGDSESFQSTVVKAADNGLLANLADLGCFARCKHGFRGHRFNHPS